MATLQEVLSDREKYPDTLMYKVGDVEMTMGELRNQMIPKGDYTKETQRWATEKDDLVRQHQTQLLAMNQQLHAMNAELERRGQQPVTTPDEAMMRLEQDIADPTLGPYARGLRTALQRVENLSKRYEEANTRLAQHEQIYALDEHKRVLRAIQQQDEEYRNPQKVQELIAFAQQYQIPNLDLAYRMKTRDRDIEAAKQAAIKETEAKYQTQQAVNAAAPHVPSGTKTGTAPPASAVFQPPPEAADPMEAATTAALSDADLEDIGRKFKDSWEGRSV